MYAGEFVTVLQGYQNAAGYLTPSRIMSRHEQIGDHSDGFVVGEALAVGLGCKQCSNEIRSRRFATTRRQLVDIALQFCDCGRRGRDLFGRHHKEHRAQGIEPMGEDRDVAVGNAEQAAHKPRGQSGACINKVAALASRCDGLGGHVGSRGAQRLDGPGRERLRNERSDAAVIIPLSGEHYLAVPLRKGIHR